MKHGDAGNVDQLNREYGASIHGGASSSNGSANGKRGFASAAGGGGGNGGGLLSGTGHSDYDYGGYGDDGNGNGNSYGYGDDGDDGNGSVSTAGDNFTVPRNARQQSLAVSGSGGMLYHPETSLTTIFEEDDDNGSERGERPGYNAGRSKGRGRNKSKGNGSYVDGDDDNDYDDEDSSDVRYRPKPGANMIITTPFRMTITAIAAVDVVQKHFFSVNSPYISVACGTWGAVTEAVIDAGPSANW